jgi:hypothetical protein
MWCLTMTFIRVKTIKGRRYHYLVQSVREGDRTYQKVIAYLGVHETVNDAYKYWQEQVRTAPDAADRKRARAMVKKLEAYL